MPTLLADVMRGESVVRLKLDRGAGPHRGAGHIVKTSVTCAPTSPLSPSRVTDPVVRQRLWRCTTWAGPPQHTMLSDANFSMTCLLQCKHNIDEMRACQIFVRIGCRTLHREADGRATDAPLSA